MLLLYWYTVVLVHCCIGTLLYWYTAVICVMYVSMCCHGNDCVYRLSHKSVVLLQNISIGEVVSERLSALRRLQTNPNDVQALTKIHHVDQQVGSLAL